ncbi:hypothetical protein PTKIN_Ptkin19aG0033700 [Pterospermum kingtungense]
MAGMLPGVEYARRRRFHLSGGSSDTPTVPPIGSTRKSAFCCHENHHTSVSSQSILIQACQDEKLGEIAREAKERLDERLRSQRKSEPKRQNSKQSSKTCLIQAELHTEVFGSKKSGQKKRFSWAKLSGKAWDEEECAICLEGFKAGETLVHPPCAHRFHSRCLLPWLENAAQAHCPCCRMGFLS